jgi:hypothetical protein
MIALSYFISLAPENLIVAGSKKKEPNNGRGAGVLGIDALDI